MQVTKFEPNIYGLYKPAGLTPLQALQELKAQQSELANTPLTYAGRLDPMAEGLLLVLAGEKVHEKEKYLGLDKLYTVTALLGFETDSYDLLGMPNMASSTPTTVEKEEIQNTMNRYVGLATLPLPPFSSPPKQGKPLFWWAKRGQTETLERTTTIYAISNITCGSITSKALLEYIATTIPKVNGDFRQLQIIKYWGELLVPSKRVTLLEQKGDPFLTTTTFTVHCSSGTYIRSLVNDLGKQINSGACVLRLIRTNIGQFSL